SSACFYRGVRWHPPPKQNVPLRHLWPQKPQFWSSKSVLVHVPLQRVSPLGQGSHAWPAGQVHVPPTHVLPPKHCESQFPQWLESVLRFWQPSLHQLGALDGHRMRPILFPPISVNQRVPPRSQLMPAGWLFMVGTGNSVTLASAGLMRPIRLAENSVNQ